MTTRQISLFGGAVSQCGICGRTLTDPASVARGIGPICASGGHIMDENEAATAYDDQPLFDFPFQEFGLVVKREGGRSGDAVKWTNIPHRVTHHSPTGFEWGYGGSGPADLALNTLQLYLEQSGYQGQRMECWEGSCFTLAWLLHQDFKRDFVAQFPEAMGTVAYEDIARWVAERRGEVEAREAEAREIDQENEAEARWSRTWTS